MIERRHVNKRPKRVLNPMRRKEPTPDEGSNIEVRPYQPCITFPQRLHQHKMESFWRVEFNLPSGGKDPLFENNEIAHSVKEKPMVHWSSKPSGARLFSPQPPKGLKKRSLTG